MRCCNASAASLAPMLAKMFNLAILSALLASTCSGTTFYFLRHAQGIHNAPPEGYDRDMSIDPDFKDARLTPYGQQQTMMRRGEYGDMAFDAMYSSPLRRCRQTLLGVYPQASVLPVVLDDRLVEQPSGHHIADRRMERSDVLAASPAAWDFSAVSEANPFSGGNATVDTANLVSFTRDVKERFPSGRVLVVAHSGVIRNWFRIHKGTDVWLDNCEMRAADM